ncbi:DNA-binding protein [Methylorubrum podarium]|uniref:DNA-binding protein n=1 Tax=Methylorubrum podarium TaxID=200476 RepID=A0ABV1QJF2_9HYPH
MEPVTENSDILYRVAAIAAFLGMPEKATRHRVEAGEIPTFRIGRTVCARRSTLNTWLAEREATGREGKANG